MSEAQYLAWIEAVHSYLRDVLGGKIGQTGSTRRYGSGVFGHGMGYKPAGEMGEVFFQVSRNDDPLHRVVPVGPFEWYAYPETVVVAKKLLDALNGLAPGVK